MLSDIKHYFLNKPLNYFRNQPWTFPQLRKFINNWRLDIGGGGVGVEGSACTVQQGDQTVQPGTRFWTRKQKKTFTSSHDMKGCVSFCEIPCTKLQYLNLINLKKNSIFNSYNMYLSKTFSHHSVNSLLTFCMILIMK